MKLGDGFMSVKIRVNMSKLVDNKEELIDSVATRRFAIYQKWLSDVKKSGVIDKNQEVVEVPQKCGIQLVQDAEQEFINSIGEQEIGKSYGAKEVCLFINSCFNSLVFGTDKQGSTSEKNEELTLYKVRLVQANQLILFVLLLAILMLLFSQYRSRGAFTDAIVSSPLVVGASATN